MTTGPVSASAAPPGNARFVSTTVGVPIGVESPRPYASVTLAVPAAATLLAFTDGLVERRGEVLDIGRSLLRDVATRDYPSVDELRSELAETSPTTDPSDDIAILGIKWTM